MHKIFKSILFAGLFLAALPSVGQEQSGVVRRRGADRNAPKQQDGTMVTERMQNFFSGENIAVSDADRFVQRLVEIGDLLALLAPTRTASCHLVVLSQALVTQLFASWP